MSASSSRRAGSSRNPFGRAIGTMFPGCPDCLEPLDVHPQEYSDGTFEMLRGNCPNECDEVPDYG